MAELGWMTRCHCGAEIESRYDPNTRSTRYQHGPNPEAVLVIDDLALVRARKARNFITEFADWLRRLHAYEAKA